MHLSTLSVVILSSSILAGAAEVGDSGELSSLMGGLQGEVVVQDDQTLTINNYELQKTGGPPLYWYGSVTDDIPHGFRISEEKIDSVQKTPTDLTVKLDAGKSLSDFNYVGLWCEPYSINFGQTKLSDDGGAASSSNSSSGSSSSQSPSPAAATTPATTENAGSSLGLSAALLGTLGFATALLMI